jgi:hypothetical protein
VDVVCGRQQIVGQLPLLDPAGDNPASCREKNTPTPDLINGVDYPFFILNIMMNSFCKFILFIFATCSFLILPRLTFSATGPYYYLHVESFRAEKSARISVKNYQRKGITAVIKKEKVAKLGDWYRVYIGPFPSRQAAKQKATELKKKGIIDYAAIKRQDSPVATTTEISAPVVKKEVKTPPQKPVSKVQQPQPPVEAKATTEVIPPPAQKQVAKKEAAIPPPEKKPPKVKPRPPIRTIRGGKGRNVAGGSVVFGFTHIYREINTELTERLDNGVPTIIDDDLKDNFPTTMNQDTLSLTLGVTDYFEFFAQGGIAYDELSDPGTVYGGGLRFNLFQTTTNSILPGFYAALQGEFLSGEFEEEFESIDGNKFERESEWQELSAGVEIGISRSKWDIYIGGYYFNYSEETERRRVDLSTVFQDELEQENDFGVYGGFTILLSKFVVLNIEGQALAQEAVLAALEFRF